MFPALSKVFERLVLNQLVLFIADALAYWHRGYPVSANSVRPRDRRLYTQGNEKRRSCGSLPADCVKEKLEETPQAL